MKKIILKSSLIIIVFACIIAGIVYKPSSTVYALDSEEPSECGVGRLEHLKDSYWGTLYTDSRGATAYGYEIEECIREAMLECGGESEEDIREHIAVYCKQLLYTQTIGGYGDLDYR